MKNCTRSLLRVFEHIGTFIAFVGAIFVLGGPITTAKAAYPDRPIKLIIPFPPGGPTDITGRVLADKLSKAIGDAIIVDNRSGASGNIGAQAAAHSPPDGYTLFFATGGTHGINTFLYPNAGYDPVKDFTPVAWITVSPNIIVVNPKFPAKTLSELITLAKANPGKFSSATPGPGSTPYMAGELFKRSAGIKIVDIPYRGSGPALNDVMGGQVPIMFDGISSSLPQVRSGRLRALAVTGTSRSPSLPNVPTISEILPGFDASGWFAVFAPAGTPSDVVTYLNLKINEVLKLPEVKARYATLGATTVGGSPQKLKTHLNEELKKWSELIKVTGMKGN